MKRLLLIVLFLFSASYAENNYSTTSNWLLDTKDNMMKFHAIQKQFRGFDLAMVEVGYRFNTFYFAIKDKNYGLANYNWDKIKKAIENGIYRRPARAANAKVMFLETQYKSMKTALAQKDTKRIFDEYENTKRTCNACHAAEKVPFIRVTDPVQRWQPVR